MARSLGQLALLWALCGVFALFARADDVEVVDEAAEEAAQAAPPASTSAAAEADGGDEDGMAKAAAMMDSAKELQEKLGQLRALLDQKGGGDPALQERLAGLEKQLDGLGLGGALGGGSAAATSPELKEFLGHCIVLSMKRAGMRRPSTVNGLAKLADKKTTQEQAAGNEFIRMVGVCLQDMTDEELKEVKQGKLTQLPKAMTTKAKSPESEESVKTLEKDLWDGLQDVAGTLNKELNGDKETPAPPIKQGLIAMIPVALIIGFLVKKFLDMEKDKKEKSKKKEERKKSK